MSGFTTRWLPFTAVVVLWELLTRLAGSLYFPPPTTILTTALEVWVTGYDDILPSLARALGGWGLAAVLGIALGTALGLSRTALDYVGGLFAFFRSVPPPALIPVFLVLFGATTTMRVVTIVFGALWPVLLNTVDGVRSVDPVQRETARSFRTPRRYWIGLVVLPAALPKIFAGLRLALSIALILMVVSELVGAVDGIGYRLVYAQRQYEFPAMWAWIVLLGVLGYALNALLLRVERQVLR